MTLRKFVMLFAGTALATSCGANSPSMNPSPLAAPGSTRLNATSGVAEVGDPAAPVPVDPGAPPAPTTIAIVGSVGTAAYNPNPLQASVGSVIVWKNDDVTTHNIVLADGTPVGLMAPGETSAPVTMAAPEMGFYCTFHQSMVGVVADPSVLIPTMPVPPMNPPPDPGYTPPPDNGGGDGYGYGYYKHRK